MIGISAYRNHKPGRQKTQFKDRHGYGFVILFRPDAPRLNVFVHRLVAEAFIGAVVGLQVNHKNGDKLDNRVENLELVTPKQNIQHMFKVLGRTMPRGEKSNRAKITAADVLEIRRLASEGHTQKSIGERFQLTRENIGKIVLRRSWKHI